jgi:hypothetical protein
MTPELRYEGLKSREIMEREIWQPWIDRQDKSDGFGYAVKYRFYCEVENRPKKKERTFHSLEDLKYWWENSWQNVQVTEMRQKHSLVNKDYPTPVRY